VQSRREQVRAYRFVTRRIVSALLSGDPESTELPMRRLGMAVFGSTMLAAIVFAAVGVYGLYNPGGGSLSDNTLVIERETGARYVFVGGVLYPALNFTSARLILGTPDPETRTMPQSDLRGLPRGRTVGIAGVPDAVPEPEALVGLPWSICSATSATTGTPTTQLTVGREVAGGGVLGGTSLLVQAGDAVYVIWHHHRLKVDNPGVLAALEIADATPIPVGDAILNAITAGPDLKAPAIPGAGDSSGREIDGRDARIGDVYQRGSQYYVMVADGLATISEVTAQLLLAGGGEARDVSANQAGELLSQARLEPEGYMTSMPRLRRLAPRDAAICATFRGSADADQNITVEFFERAPAELSAGGTTPPTTDRGVRTADRVIIDGGHGALVRALPVGGAEAPGATVYLVTDEGAKYALTMKDVDAKAALGYAAVEPLPVPASLLSLLPTGPALNPAAALSYSRAPTTATP